MLIIILMPSQSNFLIYLFPLLVSMDEGKQYETRKRRKNRREVNLKANV
jgi:hypothetical protein